MNAPGLERPGYYKKKRKVPPGLGNSHCGFIFSPKGALYTNSPALQGRVCLHNCVHPHLTSPLPGVYNGGTEGVMSCKSLDKLNKG